MILGPSPMYFDKIIVHNLQLINGCITKQLNPQPSAQVRALPANVRGSK